MRQNKMPMGPTTTQKVAKHLELLCFKRSPPVRSPPVGDIGSVWHMAGSLGALEVQLSEIWAVACIWVQEKQLEEQEDQDKGKQQQEAATNLTTPT